MRLRFWRREPLPRLAVDRTADVGAAPLDHGGPLDADPGERGYVAGAGQQAEQTADARHVDHFHPESHPPD